MPYFAIRIGSGRRHICRTSTVASCCGAYRRKTSGESRFPYESTEQFGRRCPYHGAKSRETLQSVNPSAYKLPAT